ncbi:uncharacterized protein LOC133659722 isoform X2 [Entelurus aequoreus]|uniref:uncharacterized protein LOC133659722 isoform X2 n=1 Tax=Entelurus aequoreus TaxID=161455 RepID=UPI002B1D136C|nr:uncharacterized protein LOC133659722 isoform X2 [Entelurus aequoreus]
MADGRQPEEHWASNGRENGENGHSAYSYRENGCNGGAAAHPGTTVDDSANLPPSPPPSPSAGQIGPAAQEKVEPVSALSAEERQQDEEEVAGCQEEVTCEHPGSLLLEQTDLVTEPQALGCEQVQTPEGLNGGSPHREQSPSQEVQSEESVRMEITEAVEGKGAIFAIKSNSNVGAELKTTGDTCIKSGSKTYLELVTASDMAISEGEDQHGIATREVKGQRSRAFSESYSPVTKGSEKCSPVLPSSDFIITLPEKDTYHQLPSDPHTSEQSSTYCDTLDLAGDLARTSRQIDGIRRKSMPANVLCSSLANLTLGEQTSNLLGDERQLQDLGYSGPMPSPADKPSPEDSSYSCFPAIEVQVDNLGATEGEGSHKVFNHGLAPKPPVRVILERAVNTGIKPDRLRIPKTTPKDKLTEFRLDDMKIQPIPEVDVERDSSREASPVPPDCSFIFTSVDTDSQVPLTLTSPKSLGSASKGTPLSGEKTKKVSAEPDGINTRPREKPEQENKGKKMPGDHGTTARSETREKEEIPKALKPSDGKSTFYLQEDSPKPQLPSLSIIIPQTQVEEEDDAEIAEEPQEIKDDAGINLLPKEDQAEPEMLELENHSVETCNPSVCSDDPSLPQQQTGNAKEMLGSDVEEEKKTSMENRSNRIIQKLEVSSQAVHEEEAADVSRSSWICSKDNDKTIMTKQIAALPPTRSTTRGVPRGDSPAKQAPGRGSKVSRKVPNFHPREEMKKKKGSNSLVVMLCVCVNDTTGSRVAVLWLILSLLSASRCHAEGGPS